MARSFNIKVFVMFIYPLSKSEANIIKGFAPTIKIGR